MNSLFPLPSNLTIGYPLNPPNTLKFEHGWFLETHKRIFNILLNSNNSNNSNNNNNNSNNNNNNNNNTKVIVELGCWYGISTKWFVENSNSIIYAIDLWDDSFILNDNHYNSNKELKNMLKEHPLYETFLINLWEYKERVIPLRMSTIDGLQFLFDRGIKPDIIYIDADHHYEAAKNDIKKALDLFPQAILVGDDYGNYDDVRRAVHECANEYLKPVHIDNNHCWTYCSLSSPTGINIQPKASKFSDLLKKAKKIRSSTESTTTTVSSSSESSSSNQSSNEITLVQSENSLKDNKRQFKEIKDELNQDHQNEEKDREEKKLRKESIETETNIGQNNSDII